MRRAAAAAILALSGFGGAPAFAAGGGQIPPQFIRTWTLVKADCGLVQYGDELQIAAKTMATNDAAYNVRAVRRISGDLIGVDTADIGEWKGTIPTTRLLELTANRRQLRVTVTREGGKRLAAPTSALYKICR